MIDINPIAWFGNREVLHLPPHFIKTSATLTEEKHMWVLSKLSGRYCISNIAYDDLSQSIFAFPDMKNIIFFEDPKEAMIYELRWGGS